MVNQYDPSLASPPDEVSGVGSDTASDVVNEPDGVSGEEQSVGQIQQGTETVDDRTGWVSPDDFKKFQSVYDQRDAETKKQLQAFAQAAETARQLAAQESKRVQEIERQKYEEQIARMPLEQQANAKLQLDLWNMANQLKEWKSQQEAEYQKQMQQIAFERQQFEPIAKKELISKLALEKKIPQEWLNHYADKYNDPRVVEAVADALSTATKVNTQQQRKEAAVDRTEAPGTQSGQVFDEKPFMHTGNYAQYLRELKKRGLYNNT